MDSRRLVLAERACGPSFASPTSSLAKAFIRLYPLALVHLLPHSTAQALKSPPITIGLRPMSLSVSATISEVHLPLLDTPDSHHLFAKLLQFRCCLHFAEDRCVRHVNIRFDDYSVHLVSLPPRSGLLSFFFLPKWAPCSNCVIRSY